MNDIQPTPPAEEVPKETTAEKKTAEKKPRKKTERKQFPTRRLKVERMQSPQHLADFKKLLRGPHSTAREAREWLLARGYSISESAVDKYRKRFEVRLESVRKDFDDVIEYGRAAKDAELAADIRFSDAVLMRLQHLQFDRLKSIESPAELNPKEWVDLVNLIARALRAELPADRAGSDASLPAKRGRGGKSKGADAEEPKSQAEIEAEATAAGPLLVERMRRILNL